MPTLPPPIRDPWLLDLSVRFLNHGSFGARLRSVQDAQNALRREMEARPVEFLDRRLGGLLEEARESVGRFLGMERDDFGFVTNATEGVNAILRSRSFKPGDEIITTDHIYGACYQTLRFLERMYGTVTVVVPLALPISDPATIVRGLTDAVTERTTLALVDHVTSPSALVYPVADIVREMTARNVDVLIDGAHAPGMLELDVAALGAAYYVGNLHKWIGAPPGAAFTWARADRRSDLHPTVISHDFDQGLAAEFAWQGTRDPTAWLTTPTAITAMEDEIGPWDEIRHRNRALTLEVRNLLRDRWSTVDTGPDDGSMTAWIVSMIVPEPIRSRFESVEALQAMLRDDHQIEIPVIELHEHWFIRPSCHVYCRWEDYEALADALA